MDEQKARCIDVASLGITLVPQKYNFMPVKLCLSLAFFIFGYMSSVILTYIYYYGIYCGIFPLIWPVYLGFLSSQIQSVYLRG